MSCGWQVENCEKCCKWFLFACVCVMCCCLQICCIEPLCVSQMTLSNSCSHPVAGSLLFAMASMSKILIVALRPSLQVHYKRPLTGSDNTLPLLAWHFVSIRISETERTTDPVLLFARDQYACFLQVHCFSLSPTVLQGDHLPGKPGNVREFDSCQGNVRDFTKSQGNVREENLVREKLQKTVCCKLHISVHTGI